MFNNSVKLRLSLVLLLLFVGTALTLIQTNPAHADQITSSKLVQIAQSDEEKPKISDDEEEEDLGDDDC